MNIKLAVDNFLGSTPGGHKAKEIAKAIGLDVTEVNSVLYRGLNRTYTRTGDFRWSLVLSGDNTPRSAAANNVTGAGNDRLSRLCRYYLACLAKDASNELSEWASSKYGKPAYAELVQLPLLASGEEAVWQQPDAQRLLANFRNERGRLAMFVGYPTRLRRFQSRKGEVYWKIDPLLLFEYKLPEGGGGSPILADERASINQAAVKELTGTSGAEAMDEVAQLAAEMGLDTAGIDPDDFVAVLENLASVRPEWPWREPLRPSVTVGASPLAMTFEDGVYNRAVLLLAERSPYTRGLETELASLASQGRNLSKTALGAWVTGDRLRPNALVGETDLLEVVPLNLEQHDAVRRAMTQPLTVVTGPPGTGKSQIVASIIANCIWNKQTVLLASKNNKAVDVVHTRVNALGPRPVLLRVGTGDAATGLAQHLAAILAGTATAEDESKLQEHRDRYDRLVRERSQLEHELAHTIELRNTVDQLEQQAEQARSVFGEDCFQRLRGSLHKEAESKLWRTKLAVEAATREVQGFLTRIFWGAVRSRRLEAARDALADTAQLFDLLALTAPSVDFAAGSAGGARASVAEAHRRLPFANAANQYLVALNELGRARSPEDISRAKFEACSMLQSVCSELWTSWLQLQPKRLTQTQRKALGEYKSALEMLANTPMGQGGAILRRTQELFPLVVEALPAWAVTNLAARGRLPFAPGYFDLLIIDEASQCDIASALPLLYRSRRAVIIGDPMQLQHITQLPPLVEQQLLADHAVGTDPGIAWAYSGSSLFNLASSLCDGEDIVALRDHHRSHAAIIGFSNKHFYEGRLRIATRYDRLRPRPHGDPAMRWVHVSGAATRPSSGGAVNELEARRVRA